MWTGELGHSKEGCEQTILVRPKEDCGLESLVHSKRGSELAAWIKSKGGAGLVTLIRSRQESLSRSLLVHLALVICRAGGTCLATLHGHKNGIMQVWPCAPAAVNPATPIN